MALSRRTGARFQGSIWPGFVDAMTGLLMVLFFVLTIFMIVMYVLTERISGQETELNVLANEVIALGEALGLEQDTNAGLDAELADTNATLEVTLDATTQQEILIAQLTSQSAAQAAALVAAQNEITGFEAQVAGLLTDRQEARAQVADLEGREAVLLSEQEALNLALAQVRTEVDAQAEVARLAAARREALDAMVADLQRQNTQRQAQVDALGGDLEAAQKALSEEEARKLAESAAAEALQARLQDADAELSAMTLALEAKRKEAEDTLALLAAARAVGGDLDTQLATALLKLDQAERAAATGGEAQSALQAQLADLQAQNAALSAQLSQTDQDRDAQNNNLRTQLAAALAAKLAADTLAEDTSSEAEKRAALLAQAQAALKDQEAVSTEAQRKTEVLNQQVAALRGQLGQLRALLDDAKTRDSAKEVELQSLGSELNTALARVAAEERRRAALETAERERLEAEAKRLKEQAKDLEQYRSEFFGRMRDVLGAQDGVRIDGDRFVFSSEVLFASGEVVLSEAGQREIAKVARILSTVADEIPPEIDWVIRVDGHTDNKPLSGSGQFADNWELSQARALSVVRYMIAAFDIPPGRLAANGFGEFQPVATGDSDEALALNRRIEIKFTEK